MVTRRFDFYIPPTYDNNLKNRLAESGISIVYCLFETLYSAAICPPDHLQIIRLRGENR